MSAAMQIPAHLAGRQSRHVTDALAAGIGMSAVPYISIEGNRFTLVDVAGNQIPVPTHDPQIGVYVDVVIVDANPNPSKVFYDTKYDPNVAAAPACYSDNGIGPSKNSAKPQSPTCAACPQNVWGSEISAVSGKARQACNTIKKIAVLIPNDPHKIIYRLQCPPASLKNLKIYQEGIGRHVQGDYRMEVTDIVTRIYFEKGANGILNFFATGFIEPAMAALQEEVWNSHAADKITGIDDEVRTLALPAPAAPVAALPAPSGAPPPPAPAAPAPAPAASPFPPPTGAPAAPTTGIASPAFGAPNPAPQPAQAPGTGRRRGRPPANGGPGAGVAPQAPAAPAAAPAAAPFMAAPAAPAAAPGGIIPNAPPPNAELASSLQSVFGLPT
jgi:hypothetical protein